MQAYPFEVVSQMIKIKPKRSLRTRFSGKWRGKRFAYYKPWKIENVIDLDMQHDLDLGKELERLIGTVM